MMSILSFYSVCGLFPRLAIYEGGNDKGLIRPGHPFRKEKRGNCTFLFATLKRNDIMLVLFDTRVDAEAVRKEYEFFARSDVHSHHRSCRNRTPRDNSGRQGLDPACP